MGKKPCVLKYSLNAMTADRVRIEPLAFAENIFIRIQTSNTVADEVPLSYLMAELDVAYIEVFLYCFLIHKVLRIYIYHNEVFSLHFEEVWINVSFKVAIEWHFDCARLIICHTNWPNDVNRGIETLKPVGELSLIFTKAGASVAVRSTGQSMVSFKHHDG